MDKIEFIGALGGIHFGKENDAKIKIEASASEAAAIVRLLLLEGKTFKVTIEEENS